MFHTISHLRALKVIVFGIQVDISLPITYKRTLFQVPNLQASALIVRSHEKKQYFHYIHIQKIFREL
jgi:hypothetical protein